VNKMQNAWNDPDCARSVRPCMGRFYVHDSEKVVDIGPIHATRDQTHNVPLTPIAGAAALIGGIVLLVGSGKA